MSETFLADPRGSAPSRRRRSRALALAGALGALATLPPAAAAADCAPPLRHLDMPAQPMPRSLIALGLEFGAVLSFPPALVGERQASAVRGCHSALSALAVVLQDSGLTAEAEGDRTIAIRHVDLMPTAAVALPPAALAASPLLLLDRVLVESSQAPTAREGLAPQSAQSGTRTETAMLDLPQSVFVLTRDALTLQGNPSVAQALGSVIGVDAPSNEIGSLFVDAPLHVRGLPAQMQISGVRTLRQPGTVESQLLERIEVARGPNGAISGPAAEGGRGGVINAELKRPGGGRVAEVATTLASRDGGTVSGAFDLASGGSQGLSWRVAGYGKRSGETEGGYKPDWARGGLGALRLREGPLDATLTLLGEQRKTAPPAATTTFQADYGEENAPDVESFRPGRLVPPSRGDGLSLKTALVDVDLRWRLSPDWRTTFLLRRETTRSTTIQTRLSIFGFEEPSFDEVRSRTRLESMQWSLAGNAATGPVEHRLLFAVDKDRWSVDDLLLRGQWFYPFDAPFVPGVDTLDPAYLLVSEIGDGSPGSRVRHWGVLMQDQASWGPLELRLALRRGEFRQSSRFEDDEYVSSRAPRRTSGDVGIGLRVAPSATVYAGTQRTYEASYRASDDEAVLLPRIRQHQIGAKWALQEDRALFGVELFELEVLDLNTFEQREDVELDELSTGLPGRVTRGLEIEYVGRVTAALDASIGLSLMRSRETAFNIFAETYQADGSGVPSRALRLLAQYRLDAHGLARTSVGFGLLATSSRWVTARDTTDPNDRSAIRLPGAATLDLSIKREFDGWDLTGSVYNLTDRRVYGNYAASTFVPIGPPRWYSLGVRVRF
ncbi:MAG TPA: TonB-dependent receptor plug domain-containing protein [Methylibium sp.]|uniref:TonB-dependent receptor plug domain-containing protein n=1 Tax=Methylibium sp. TaxID=2067992 RepID=UPI002DBA02A3|nr:TonB-dependent receptor plug domain-containing protein [Methylibium sp.]HEU4459581.1 TonB-dependent receptor plug domain-containing protein [Methylibium sp.]